MERSANSRYYMNEKSAVEALRYIKEVFDAHGIEYWLDYGTLLGAIRDGKFIPWDHDVDIGALDSEESKIKIVSKELCKKGLDLFFLELQGDMARILIEENLWVDIYFYSSVENNKISHVFYVHHNRMVGQVIDYLYRVLLPSHALDYKDGRMPDLVTKKLCKIMHRLPISLKGWIVEVLATVYKKIGSEKIRMVVPNHYFKNLSTMEFYGMEFKVPSPVEEYLTYKYGKNWETPKEDYMWWEEDGSIIKDQK